MAKAEAFFNNLIGFIQRNADTIKKLVPALLGLIVAFKMIKKVQGIAGLFGGKGGSGGGIFSSLTNLQPTQALKGMANLAIILGGLAAKKDRLRPLYSGELMLGGGSIRGWAVEDEALCGALSDAIEALGSQEAFDREFPTAAGQPPITLAVGDGNHSLATAKAYWEELKSTLPPEQRETHPARWCLAEVCNLYSDSIQIESIPRVLFDVSADEVLRQLHAYGEERHLGLHLGEAPKGRQSFTLATPDGRETAVSFDTPTEPLAVGLILPPFDKADILKGVVLGGVLPRKTFSMGHAEEKRYYLEAREIQG